MKWTPEQVDELTNRCFAEETNDYISVVMGIPLTDIYAKRSQLGITRAKVAVAKTGKAPMAPNPEFEAVLGQRMERFDNAGEHCIVLARQGTTALIVRPNNRCTPYVVPLEHKPGAPDWWQGSYFDSLGAAWAYYQSRIAR